MDRIFPNEGDFASSSSKLASYLPSWFGPQTKPDSKNVGPFFCPDESHNTTGMGTQLKPGDSVVRLEFDGDEGRSGVYHIDCGLHTAHSTFDATGSPTKSFRRVNIAFGNIDASGNFENGYPDGQTLTTNMGSNKYLFNEKFRDYTENCPGYSQWPEETFDKYVNKLFNAEPSDVQEHSPEPPQRPPQELTKSSVGGLKRRNRYAADGD
ncbi:uncharacterized protein L203_101934 [Cryptococcus depauperatus CBS 7841]|uniref:Uncharacterized protein n=1 Tax=Cryptococcus depauperatus CBS 7841 TaxID=1295531 RepID=A0A1E3IJ44_9TREE|nr:hypothetical protein L203_03180 [Cryptococcus depauperatus CBS 7841]